MRSARGDVTPLPEDQRWQGQLWRAVIADVDPLERELGRATVHTEFVRASAAGEEPLGRLPRRVVIFGVSALPFQTLQALAAIARHTQVLLAAMRGAQQVAAFDDVAPIELARIRHRQHHLRVARQ